MGTLTGGGEVFDSNAAKYLTMSGHHVKVLTGRPLWGGAANKFSELDVEYVPAPNLRLWAYKSEKLSTKLSAAFYYLDLYLFERSALKWLATRNRFREFDVVQVCGLFGLAEVLLRRWQLPTVGWLPGIPSRRTRSKIRRLVSFPRFRLFSRGDPVRFVKKEMGLPSIEVIEPGLEIDKFCSGASCGGSIRQQLGISATAVVGCTVARLVPVKNLDFLLAGLALAAEEIPDLHHLIVGSGPLYDELSLRVRSLGLDRQVHFLGHQDRASVYSLLAQSDFFVLTSKYENFSNAVLEAMGHGLPVIGTAVGYLKDLIADSGAGILVPLGDEVALKKAIVRVALDADLRGGFSNRGVGFVRQFDWKVIAEKLVSLYRKAGSD